MEHIIDVLKLEDKFQAVIFFPWNGNSLILRTELKDVLRYLPEEDDTIRSLITLVIKRYPNAKLQDMRTLQNKKIRITLSFYSKEEFDRFYDEVGNIKAIMAQVSVPWNGGYVSLNRDFKNSEEHLNLLGGSETWRAHRLIKHLVKNYDENLIAVESDGEKLLATVKFTQKDELDAFCQEHRA